MRVQGKDILVEAEKSLQIQRILKSAPHEDDERVGYLWTLDSS